MSSSTLRPAASSSGDLPPDALYEILLILPAKELCRLRAVCPSWRALTSDPLFVAAHTSRHHTAPLLAIAYRDEIGVNGVEISDLSGNVVRRIPCIGSNHDDTRVLRTRLDLICFTRRMQPWGLSVLNPATGATLALPERRSEELERELEGGHYRHGEVQSCAFGQVFSTGEYKALRITRLGVVGTQLCEVITFDGTNHGGWRGKQGPPTLLGTSDQMKCVVVDEVVFFLMDFLFSYLHSGAIVVEPGSIASFNLETEEWMGTLRGPIPVRTFVEDNSISYSRLNSQLSLAELNGCLVTVHNIHNISMDLWFLTDLEKGIWIKKYSMPSQARRLLYPFFLLDNGRILFSHGKRSVENYDPRNGTYADVLEVRDSKSIGIYTGNPLSL